MNRMTGEEFLQSKDIWNHPTLTDRNNKECYDVAELLEEYATGEPKRKPLSDGTLPLTNGEMSELCEIMGYQNICKIFYDNKLHFKCFDKGWGIITDVKAVLYLAERFNLTGEK